MSNDKTKAFEYTKDIVIATLGTNASEPCKAYGEYVADYFEVIFNKLVEIEKTI